jgi:hypothetical protein
MGLINNGAGVIFIDCVVTDLGRDFLSRNDGSFNIVRYNFGDDEIDYTQFVPTTGTLQQDINILNTPIFEANVNETVALKYPLISISNPNLTFLPSLGCTVSALSLGERTDAQVGKHLTFTQNTQQGQTVPSEIIDASFIVQMPSSLLFLEQQTPVSISPYGTAQYIVPRTAIGANQGAQVTFNISVQSLSSFVWNTLGVGTVGSRTITATVLCQGALSGLQNQLVITINEQFSH